jgi:hypothetical protein
MATTYYHSTRSPLAIRSGRLSMTDDYDASVEYLEGHDGHVYAITLPAGLDIASECEVVAVAREIDPATPYRLAWELVEQDRRVMAELMDRGYDGMMISDQTPSNRSEHMTVTIFDASAIELTIEEV